MIKDIFKQKIGYQKYVKQQNSKNNSNIANIATHLILFQDRKLLIHLINELI